MKWLYLAYQNLKSDRLKSALSIILMGMGLGLMCFFMVSKRMIQDNFKKNLAGVNLVLAAKGSPLQSVLCNLFHTDVPTGNIKVKDAKPFLNPKHPLLKQAVPLSLGDNYKNYRIVGTTDAFKDLYDLNTERGHWFEKDLECVIGSEVAAKLKLNIGDAIKSVHGIQVADELSHQHDDAFTIVGILKPTMTVADQLILCPASSIWMVHSHDHTPDHSIHNPATTNASLMKYADEEITSLLLQFRGTNVRTLNLKRNIDEHTPMMAASPSYELNNLFDQLGVGFQLLQWISFLILAISALSIWMGMSISLDQRKYELALIKSFGSTTRRVNSVILLEAMLIAFFGYLLANILFYSMIVLTDVLWTNGFRFGSWNIGFFREQLLILGVSVLLALLSVIFPLIRLRRLDVARLLAQK